MGRFLATVRWLALTTARRGEPQRAHTVDVVRSTGAERARCFTLQWAYVDTQSLPEQCGQASIEAGSNALEEVMLRRLERDLQGATLGSFPIRCRVVSCRVVA